MKTFGEQVLAAIEARDLSVAEAARMADVKYDVIRDLKRRPKSNPTAEHVRKLATAFDIDVRSTDGFADGDRQPRIDVGAALDAHAERLKDAGQATKTADEKHAAIKIAVAGDTLQVFATVDDADFDELIRRLKIARQMLGS